MAEGITWRNRLRYKFDTFMAKGGASIFLTLVFVFVSLLVSISVLRAILIFFFTDPINEFVYCFSQFLETLLQTFQHHIEKTKSTEQYEEGLIVVKRFIRAVIRVYVVLAACTGSNSSKKKG